MSIGKSILIISILILALLIVLAHIYVFARNCDCPATSTPDAASVHETAEWATATEGARQFEIQLTAIQRNEP